MIYEVIKRTSLVVEPGSRVIVTDRQYEVAKAYLTRASEQEPPATGTKPAVAAQRKKPPTTGTKPVVTASEQEPPATGE